MKGGVWVCGGVRMEVVVCHCDCYFVSTCQG